jgi:hypothetical protein
MSSQHLKQPFCGEAQDNKVNAFFARTAGYCQAGKCYHSNMAFLIAQLNWSFCQPDR